MHDFSFCEMFYAAHYLPIAMYEGTRFVCASGFYEDGDPYPFVLPKLMTMGSPAIYVSSDTGYYGYELARLTDYTFWCTSLGNHPFFYYAHTLWQYSFDGKVPGIDHKCDMNMMFYK